MDDSSLYLDIYIWGLPFVFFYNVATGIFSALGDSKTPFIFLACSSLSNIAVDILFVTAFNMGVAGVAWATFLCQGVSCVLALCVVFQQAGARSASTDDRARLFSGPHSGRDRAHCRAQHFAAELYLGGQHRYPERHQQLRRRRHGGLFGGGQAQQPGGHLLYHAGQRRIQLHRPEPGRRTSSDRVQ